MFHTNATGRPLTALTATPTQLFEGDMMFNPKWGVLAVVFSVFALAASYDAQLGLAVGIAIVVIAAITLWIQVRFAFEPGESPADRSALAQRFKRLGRNRRAAQAAAQEERKRP